MEALYYEVPEAGPKKTTRSYKCIYLTPHATYFAYHRIFIHSVKNSSYRDMGHFSGEDPTYYYGYDIASKSVLPTS